MRKIYTARHVILFRCILTQQLFLEQAHRIVEIVTAGAAVNYECIIMMQRGAWDRDKLDHH